MRKGPAESLGRIRYNFPLLVLRRQPERDSGCHRSGPRAGGIRRSVWVVVGLLLAALAVTPSAFAKRGMVVGFSGTDQYQEASPADRSQWMGRTVDADGGMVRLSVGWAYVAPTRPLDPTNPGSVSYDFSSLDGPVRDAAARGLKVLLTVNVAPDWAEGPGKPPSTDAGTWKVSPSDLADFNQALATRYSGTYSPPGQPPLPAVDAIEVWNEPNASDWIEPQFEGKTAVSPDAYRAMLNASYTAIKQVSPRIQVVAAGTAPYGDPPGGPYPGGDQRVQPVQFWQRLLCVQPKKTKKKGKKGKQVKKKYVRAKNCSGRAMLDVFAHHAIDNTGGGPLRSGPLPGDVSTPDLGRLVPIFRAAEKLGTVSGGSHPVWVTEFWWDSKPPNPVGAPLLTQARWIEQSLYLFWKAGASLAVNFQIGDSAARPDVHAGLQSGVYFSDGRPKPSLTAVQFPFVTERLNPQTLTAWGKAPEAGKLRIQKKQGSRWVTVKKLQAGKGMVFTTQLPLRGKQQLRAVVGGSQSIVWKQAGADTKNASSSGGGGTGTATILLLLAVGLGLIVGGTALLRRRQRRMQQRRRPRPALP